MVATPSKLMSFAAVATTCLIAVVTAAPVNKNPVVILDGDASFLSSAHPAYGAPLSGDVVQPIILDADITAEANSLTITNSSAIEVRSAGEGARMLEDAPTDLGKLQAYFGKSLEVNYNTLIKKYSSAAAKQMPWASSYWAVYQDSINVRWTNEASPAEKYAKAFGKNVKQFMDRVSALNGIDTVKGKNKACTSDSQCASIGDGSKCAKREGYSSGYCIPTWWGICHAWAPAANWEPEPQCDVEKNGVTFHPYDLKGLVTAVYDGADIDTVFTGTRFNGPDSPASLDQYGRYTSATRRDIGAGLFHIAISNIMGQFGHSFIVDVTAGAEVWNQPVRSYQVLKSEIVDIQKTSKQYYGTNKYPFNNQAKYLAYTKTRFSWIVEAYEDGPINPSKTDKYTRSADFEYFLELDGSYNIIGGEWIGESRYDHPDFLWFAKSTPPLDTVTDLGLSYREIRSLIDQSVACKNQPKPTTPAPTSAKPTDKPTSTPAPTTATPTDKPTSTPEPTKDNGKPTETPEPTKGDGKPTQTPEPTKDGKPTQTPAPTKDGKPTQTPEPTKDGKPTQTPAPTKDGKPTQTPAPTKDGKPTQTPEPTKDGKPTQTPAPTKDGKPTQTPAPTKDGKPTQTPEPTKDGKPTQTPAPTKDGKPTQTPAPTKDGKPTQTPAPTKDGKPTQTPAPSSNNGKPTPPPETTKPTPGKPTETPCPSKDGKPTPAPETTKPTPGKPTQTPAPSTDNGKPTPAPETGKPTPPTPAPETTKPTTGKPSDTPAPSTENGKPTPAPVTGKPTPPEGPATVKPNEPTPAPQTGKPTPPEGPATVKPSEPTPAPVTGKPTPPEGPATVKPSEPTPAPPTGDAKPTPAPSKPTDPDAPGTVGPNVPSTAPSPSATPSVTTTSPDVGTPTAKPSKKPKQCHA